MNARYVNFEELKGNFFGISHICSLSLRDFDKKKKIEGVVNTNQAFSFPGLLTSPISPYCQMDLNFIQIEGKSDVILL